MKTIFIRHKYPGRRQVLSYLFKERKIAIHYKDTASLDPKDYDGSGRRAFEFLLQCCEEGAFVGAVYYEVEPSKMIVGIIRKGKARDIIKPEPLEGHIYKVIKLVKAQITEHPVFLGSQPRMGTISHWKTVSKQLEAVINGKALPWEVNSLHHSQIEVLCYEYLRLTGILRALIMPIGRTLRDVDIYGINSKGQFVIAQVTFETNLKKIDSLKAYIKKKAICIFFGPAAGYNLSKFDGINYIPIEKVFSALSKSSVGHQMVKAMIDLKSAECVLTQNE